MSAAAPCSITPSLALPILGQVAPRPAPTAPLPMSRAEMEARGWDEVDIVFVTGDANVRSLTTRELTAPKRISSEPPAKAWK